MPVNYAVELVDTHQMYGFVTRTGADKFLANIVNVLHKRARLWSLGSVCVILEHEESEWK